MSEIETLSPPSITLTDFVLPHFVHKDFDSDKPEAILTLYIGAMHLIFSQAAFGKLYIDGKSGLHYDAPALFSVGAAADNTSALVAVPKEGERLLCSADWQVHNIDSGEKTGLLRVSETLTYRVPKTRYTRAGNPYASVAMSHDYQDEMERTPHQLGATFFYAAMTLLPSASQRSVRKYLHAHNIAEPAMELHH